MTGYVYLIGSGHDSAVKIGFTKSDPEARCRSLQTGCPNPLDLLAYWPGTMEDERKLHITFEPVQLHGEWFGIEGKLADFVWYIVEAGEPRVRFRERKVFEGALWDAVITEIGPWAKPETAYPEIWHADFADILLGTAEAVH